MLCCMRRTKQVERQEDADQKIEQDANKPEDKAHKAATKIQASFRGHIIRKKMKGDQPEADIKANGEAVDNKQDEYKANKTQDAPCDTTSPKEEQKQEDKPHLAKKSAEEKAPSPAATPEDKKADLAKPESTTEKGSNESLLSSDPSATQVKADSKQADVPAEYDAKEGNTAKDQEKTDKEATSPVEAKHSEKAAPVKLQTRFPIEMTLPAKSQSMIFSDSATPERPPSRLSDAVEETKPTESAQQENVVAEENKADQENA